MAISGKGSVSWLTLAFDSRVKMPLDLRYMALDAIADCEVRRETVSSVRVLADRMGRDYKRVHSDVDRLAAVGLLVRDEAGISAPYDVIQVDFDLRAVA